jgi:hypothetical protein
MITSKRRLIQASATVMILAAAPMVGVSFAPPAVAQADRMGGIGEQSTISLRATVESIDQQSRVVTLVGPQGNSLTMQVGPEVHNLAQVKQGDKVLIHYHGSIAYVLAPPGTKLPDNALVRAGVRAPQGQTPAGAVGAKLVITSTVVGIDPMEHTLQLIDPSGGRVRTVEVTSQRGQRAMRSIKVGDTITAIITEAVAVALEPVT